MMIRRKTLYTIFSGLVAGLLVVGGLFLDLAKRGPVWDFAWSVTGEEAPVAQVRGVLQWLTGLPRPRPHVTPLAPINHTNLNPYGINTFLELEADPDKVEAQVAMIAEAGFAWIRQQFVWEDIEVDGRGQFTDSRNDMTGDGIPDTISAWDKYDRIVDLADRYGLRIQARLDNPPEWSRSDPALGDFGPPDDLQDFVNFAVAVAQRYQGRVQHFQIWNEPNLGFEWGERPVDPERYTELLCRTYDALKAVDPEIVVITGALAPTIDLSGYNLMDFIYLQRMYDAGAGACFDVLSVQGYGLFSGPTDRRLRPTTINFGRNQYIRDIMVANGDSQKSIWVSEAAWNAVPTEAEYPEHIDARYAFGQVTQQQAAEYMPLAYERAQREWPWIGVVNYWFFTRPNDLERGQSFYYFRMVEPDYSDEHPTFTPLPIYHAMQNFIANQTPVLYRGVHQADQHWAIDAAPETDTVESPAAQFGAAARTTGLDFSAHGTQITIRWQGESLAVRVDGAPVSGRTSALADGWQHTTVSLGRGADSHRLSLTADSSILVDSITVRDRTIANWLPFIVAAITGIVTLAAVLVDIAASREHSV